MEDKSRCDIKEFFTQSDMYERWFGRGKFQMDLQITFNSIPEEDPLQYPGSGASYLSQVLRFGKETFSKATDGKVQCF